MAGFGVFGVFGVVVVGVVVGVVVVVVVVVDVVCFVACLVVDLADDFLAVLDALGSVLRVSVRNARDIAARSAITVSIRL
jgi:hypothetical protein